MEQAAQQDYEKGKRETENGIESAKEVYGRRYDALLKKGAKKASQ